MKLRKLLEQIELECFGFNAEIPVMLYRDCNIFVKSSNSKSMLKDFDEYLDTEVLVSGDSDETGGYYIVIS